MAAEVDFEWRVTPEIKEVIPAFANLKDGSIQNGEVKTSHPWGAGEWGDVDTDEIPIAYGVQTMFSLGVTKRDACLVALLVGSDQLLIYHILRDESVITEMRQRCVAFWNDHVLKQVPPRPQDLGDGVNLLRQRKDVTVQADPEMLGLVLQLIEWGEAKSKAEAAQKEIQFHLVSKLVGEEAAQAGTMENKHRIMHAGKPILTVGLQGRDSIRMKELHAEHPDIYEEFVKHSTFFVCRPTRSK